MTPHEKYLEVLERAKIIRVARQKIYGESWYFDSSIKELLMLVEMKLKRLKVLINNKNLNNVDKQMDSILDMINYAAFLAVILEKK